MANFYTWDPHCHFWLLQNPQWFFGLWGSLGNRQWRKKLKKCIFHIPPPSLWQISILATRIAISEYNKTRNGFLDPGGHQKTVCEEKRKKWVFYLPPPAMVFWTLGVTKKQAVKNFYEKMRFSNYTSVPMANFYTCNPHCHSWILQNLRWFFGLWASPGNRQWRKTPTSGHIVIRYGEFPYLRPALPIACFLVTLRVQSYRNSP